MVLTTPVLAVVTVVLLHQCMYPIEVAAASAVQTSGGHPIQMTQPKRVMLWLAPPPWDSASGAYNASEMAFLKRYVLRRALYVST